MFIFNGFDQDVIAGEINSMFTELFPICRSITGNGVRKTLKILGEKIDLKINEISSGTICYDWTVPREWNIKDAYVADSKGNKLIDFQKNNLHVVSYSEKVNKYISFEELKKHLHTLPNLPDAIPYRTSYYEDDWGFCLSHNEFVKMNEKEKYHVVVNSEFKNGNLTYGESYIEGTSGVEYIISTYCCHPSLANDNLSGMVLATLLFRELKKGNSRHSYRLIIVPETIGAISYMSQNEDVMKKISDGFVVTTVAGPGEFGYKQSFKNGSSEIDRAVKITFRELGIQYISYPFDVYGSDEKQYAAAYFRIPTGTITKDKYYEYDYYHTSLDNLDFISASNLMKTLEVYLYVIEKLEMNLTYRTLCPKCQPMLGKRDLYPNLGGALRQKAFTPSGGYIGNRLDAILWLMFYCDSNFSILDISEKTNISMGTLYSTAEILVHHGLLERG